jgi:hypothetical protein
MLRLQKVRHHRKKREGVVMEKIEVREEKEEETEVEREDAVVMIGQTEEEVVEAKENLTERVIETEMTIEEKIEEEDDNKKLI